MKKLAKNVHIGDKVNVPIEFDDRDRVIKRGFLKVEDIREAPKDMKPLIVIQLEGKSGMFYHPEERVEVE
jgi:hypothetical protein